MFNLGERITVISCSGYSLPSRDPVAVSSRYLILLDRRWNQFLISGITILKKSALIMTFQSSGSILLFYSNISIFETRRD